MKIANMEAEITNGDGFITISFKTPTASFIRFVEALKNADKGSVKVVTKSGKTILLSEKVNELYLKVKAYQTANPTKYPRKLYAAFMTHWSEPDKNSKAIRYDGEKYFEIGKRLATFKNFTKPEVLSKWWEEHNQNSDPKTLF